MRRPDLDPSVRDRPVVAVLVPGPGPEREGEGRAEDEAVRVERLENDRLVEPRIARASDVRRLSPSHRKEYVEWITKAKRDETRRRRLATALEWRAEGKARNWKYEKC
ncbi:MAG: YdeI/OmpD-associated family protein [Deltaproteobacteria bacterium]|nr:YdeI/OmpD-associated family protein [Deltaproteobacteria bacterium]